MIPNDRADDLEAEIRSELDAMNSAPDRSTAQQHWQAAVRLIGQRSAEKIAQMEAERGLR